MEKAFDLKALGEAFKAAGLPMLEIDLKLMTKIQMKWIKDSLAIEAVQTPWAAMGIPVVDKIEEFVLKYEDKIDGVEGN